MNLVVWEREVVGNVVGGLSNQKYVQTPEGYIYGSIVQPTRNLPNTPITEIPAGQSGFWGVGYGGSYKDNSFSFR